jgi:hypothetical protein
MKNIQIFAATLAAVVMLASCGKEETGKPVDGDGTTSVKIEFSYPDSPATRAEGAPVGNGTDGVFKPGHIFFVTGTGQIDTHVGVGTTVTPSTAGSVKATIEDLTKATGSEVVINGVSSAAVNCYILSNDAVLQTSDAISGNLEGTNISQVLAKVFPVNKLNTAAGDVANVPMYGPAR